jgi:hydrogenase maturation protease
MGNKLLILGVGNSMRQDDGIGPKIVNLIQEKQLSAVDVINGGIDGLSLLDVIVYYERAIIIDAIDMQADPGTIKVFAPEQAKIIIKSDALSTHGFGLAEVIKLAEELGIEAKLTIVGVQPQTVGFGEWISSVVANKIPELVDIVLRLYQDYLKELLSV